MAIFKRLLKENIWNILKNQRKEMDNSEKIRKSDN
jgi:hypothetical protein